MKDLSWPLAFRPDAQGTHCRQAETHNSLMYNVKLSESVSNELHVTLRRLKEDLAHHPRMQKRRVVSQGGFSPSKGYASG